MGTEKQSQGLRSGESRPRSQAEGREGGRHGRCGSKVGADRVEPNGLRQKSATSEHPAGRRLCAVTRAGAGHRAIRAQKTGCCELLFFLGIIDL